MGVVFIAVRATGLILHFFARDPHGNAISSSPLASLMIALPYHGAVVLGSVVSAWALWRLLPKVRAVITVAAIGLWLVAIMIGQIDLGMQWFIGQRFSPMVFDTYVGRHLLSNDLYEPVLFYPGYLGVALLLMLGPWVVLAVNLLRRTAGAAVREPGWKLIAGLAVLTLLCRIPIQLAYGHQRDVLRPPELLFANHWLNPSETPVPVDEPKAIAALRAAADPTGGGAWLDESYPLMRSAPVRVETVMQPDIFIFTIESLRGGAVGYVPGNYAPGETTPTPRLDRLAKSGVVFSGYISSGNPSPRGFFGINAGVWDHRSSFIISGSTGTAFDALPLRLRREGYATLGAWGSNPSFDNQLFWGNKWFDRMIYPEPAGRMVITHPLGDDVLMERLIGAVAEHDRDHAGRPLYAYVANAGTHEPYVLQGETSLPPEVVRATADEQDIRLRYRAVLHNLDTQIGRVLDFLDTRKTGRPVVIVITGDHSDLAGDEVQPEMRGLPHNAVEWTSALIAGPAELIGPPRVETFPASHVDLLPTLSELAGARGPVVTMGMDLFADIPLAQRRAVSVSGRGFRLDRDGWSLLVKRDEPGVFWTMPSFAPLSSVRAGVEGSPFTREDAQGLREVMDTWSFLLEHNRVWRETYQDSGAGFKIKTSAGP